jgi:hypothetical protein
MEKVRARGSIVLVALILGALSWSAACAEASEGHAYERSFGPDCTAASHFRSPGAVAVDEANGFVYVADQPLNREPGNEPGTNEVFRCTTAGAEAQFSAGPGAGTNHISGFGFSSGQATSQIAVSPTNHDFYVADFGNLSVKAFNEAGEPALFTAGPGAGTNELFGFFPCGVATDVSGDIYAAYASGGAEFTGGITVFAPSGEELTSFETSSPCNLAVDSHGAIYVVHVNAKSVEKLTPSVFPVSPATTYNGSLADGGADYSVAVDPSNDDLFLDRRTRVGKSSRILQRDAAGNPLDSFPLEGEAGAFVESEGLAADGATGDVYASDAAGETQVKVFAAAAANPPVVIEASTTDVAAASADLQALVSPEHFATQYRFQYLTRAEYQAAGETFSGAGETAVANLGNAGIPQSARAHLTGLTPDTQYVFRVAVENRFNIGSPVFSAVSLGGEGEFRTFAALPKLADGRAYELVSPATKAGEVYVPEKFGELNGTCEAEGHPSSECYPGQIAQAMPMQAAADGEAVAYEGGPFSTGLASPTDEYLSRRGPGGWTIQNLSTSQFINGPQGQGYQNLSAGLSRGVYFQVESALSPLAPSREGKPFANLYLREDDGTLVPLVATAPPNRSPGELTAFNAFQPIFGGGNAGTDTSPAFTHIVFAANDALTGATAFAPAAVDGGSESDNVYEWVAGQLRLVNVMPDGTTEPGAVIGSGPLLKGHTHYSDYDHAISDDGSHIFWSNGATGQVYVRIGGEETVKIEDSGAFLKASADGSKVLLNDGCLYSLASKSCEDLTLGHEKSSFSGILGAAEDLSRVYFVDTDVLTGSEENANHESAAAGEPNLYYWRQGAVRFLGVLNGSFGASDNRFPFNQAGEFGDWAASPSSRLAQVSPDGTRLAFMSMRPLTGYDNEARGGVECQGNRTACFEVFEYDAGTNQLTCASCNPTGQRPLGRSTLSLINGFSGSPPLPQPHNLSPNGRLFFESQDVLSPYDTNGRTTDVYEWEPNGLGSCQRAGGCVSLISSGNSGEDSFFVDSAASGDDAFFVTRSELVPADQQEQIDLYDARAPHVPGEQVGFPEGETAPCSAEGCKGAASATPEQPGAASSSFSGPGNLKECRHGKKLQKGKCVPKKQKAKKKHHKKKGKHKKANGPGSKTPKRANSNRGGSK